MAHSTEANIPNAIARFHIGREHWFMSDSGSACAIVDDINDASRFVYSHGMEDAMSVDESLLMHMAHLEAEKVEIIDAEIHCVIKVIEDDMCDPKVSGFWLSLIAFAFLVVGGLTFFAMLIAMFSK